MTEPGPRLVPESNGSAGPSNPQNSPSQLILVHDPEEHPDLELWQDDSNAEDEDDDEPVSAVRRDRDILPRYVPNSSPLSPPLSRFYIFLILLATTLRLGTTLLIQTTSSEPLPLPLWACVVSLIGFATLSSLATQIYLMLGQYVKRWSVETIVGAAFVGVGKAHRLSESKEAWKTRLVTSTKIWVVICSALLCASYLRESADLLVPFVPKTSYTFHRVGVTLLLALVATPLMGPTTLAYQRVTYANLLSVVLHIALTVLVVNRRAQSNQDQPGRLLFTRGIGLIHDAPSRVRLDGGAWEWFTYLALAFSTQLLTYPLYASHKNSVSSANSSTKANQARQRRSRVVSRSPTPPSPNSRNQQKPPKAQRTVEFASLATTSSVFSIILIALPLFVSRTYGTNTSPPNGPGGGSPLPSFLSRPDIHPIPVLQSCILLLAIPPVWIAVITPRLKGLDAASSSNGTWRWDSVRWRWVLWVALVTLATFASHPVARKIEEVAIWSVIGFGYVLPGFLHVTLHTFRSPLAIVLPEGAVSTDDLLQRKERALQKKRLKRRLGWDLAVWLALLPVGLAVWVWSGGRCFGLW